jgi:SAM-dependent methyltransferase
VGIATPVDGRWNHNVAYHSVVLDALPTPLGSVLDVGCGEGTLARQLAPRAAEVTGIDLHEPSIARARAWTSATNVRFVLGDVLEHPAPISGYDAVVSVAMVHHLDLGTALARLDELTVPGGTVVVIGLARSVGPRDLALDATGAVTSRAIRLRQGWWEHPSPIVWPPPTTYAEVCATSSARLPGSRFHRHLLFRYSIVWRKPR